MGQQGTLYQIVLVAHILCAIAGFGAVLLNGLYAAETRKRPGPEGLAIYEANYKISEIAEYFIYAVAILGFALVGLSDKAWTFSQTWVWLSIVIYAVALGVSRGFLLPRVRQMGTLMREMVGGPPPAGPPPQAAAMEQLGKQVGAASGFLHLSMLVIIVLMVFKPGA